MVSEVAEAIFDLKISIERLPSTSGSLLSLPHQQQHEQEERGRGEGPPSAPADNSPPMRGGHEVHHEVWRVWE